MQTQDMYVRNAAIHNAKAWDGVNRTPDAGDYEAVVAEMKREPSSKKGITQLVVQWEIVAKADGSDTDAAGRKAFARYNEEGNLSRLRQFLEATGVEIDDEGGYNPAEALGVHALITITKQEGVKKDEDGNTVPTTYTNVCNERLFNGAQPSEDDEEEYAAASDDDGEGDGETEEEPPARAVRRSTAPTKAETIKPSSTKNGSGKAPAKFDTKPRTKRS